jgi:hypothetical protein
LGAEIKNLIAGALMRPASANALAFVGDPADAGKTNANTENVVGGCSVNVIRFTRDRNSSLMPGEYGHDRGFAD